MTKQDFIMQYIINNECASVDMKDNESVIQKLSDIYDKAEEAGQWRRIAMTPAHPIPRRVSCDQSQDSTPSLGDILNEQLRQKEDTTPKTEEEAERYFSALEKAKRVFSTCPPVDYQRDDNIIYAKPFFHVKRISETEPTTDYQAVQEAIEKYEARIDELVTMCDAETHRADEAMRRRDHMKRYVDHLHSAHCKIRRQRKALKRKAKALAQLRNEFREYMNDGTKTITTLNERMKEAEKKADRLQWVAEHVEQAVKDRKRELKEEQAQYKHDCDFERDAYMVTCQAQVSEIRKLAKKILHVMTDYLRDQCLYLSDNEDPDRAVMLRNCKSSLANLGAFDEQIDKTGKIK